MLGPNHAIAAHASGTRAKLIREPARPSAPRCPRAPLFFRFRQEQTDRWGGSGARREGPTIFGGAGLRPLKVELEAVTDVLDGDDALSLLAELRPKAVHVHIQRPRLQIELLAVLPDVFHDGIAGDHASLGREQSLQQVELLCSQVYFTFSDENLPPVGIQAYESTRQNPFISFPVAIGV